MANTPVIPTISNWGEITSKNYYQGVEVVKVNKTSVRPLDGKHPMFHYVNAKGVKGDWYNVADVQLVDKVMQGENKAFANRLEKLVKKGDLDIDQLKTALEALNIQV